MLYGDLLCFMFFRQIFQMGNDVLGKTSDESSSKSLEGQRRRVTRGNDEESCEATTLPIGKVLAK